MPARDAIDEKDLIAADRAYRIHRLGITVDGVPFNLKLYPWVIDALNCEHPHIVWRKGAQMGLSVAMILRTIDMSAHIYPRGVLYLMPTQDDVSDFSTTRFKRFMDENEDTLGRLVRGTDKVGVKRIGNAFIYFRGAKSRSQLKSIPVDALYTDEEDEMEAAMVELAEHRLDGSLFKHHCRLSTPTIPGYGVDYYFEKSDQHHWHIRCEACGKFTCLELEFPHCLERGKDGQAFRACVNCHRKIHPVRGQWVAASPERNDVRGYYISQLNSPTIKPTTILDEWESGNLVGEKLQEFMNSRLGQPHADLEDMLTEALIRECCGPNPKQLSDEGPCLMGADVGKKEHHYFIGKRVGEKQVRIIDFGTGDFNHLSDKISRFSVKVACFDMMAEMHAVRAFQDAHPSVWGVIYSEAQRNAYNWQPEERKVTVNRSELLDHSHRAVLTKDLSFPRPGQDWKDLVKQLSNLARIVVRDPDTGTPKVRWVIRGRKNDHWRHALAYLTLAAETAPYSADYRRATRRIGERTSGLTWMSG